MAVISSNTISVPATIIYSTKTKVTLGNRVVTWHQDASTNIVVDLPQNLPAGSYLLNVGGRSTIAVSIGTGGPAGPQGIPGANGTNGLAGVTGPQGPAGPAGPQGPMGQIGSQGPVGPQGSVGPAGAAGPQGPQGVPGTNGLNGVTGPQGPIGLTGPAGPKGLQGVPGTNGLNGAAGPQGPIGPAGPVGPMGPQGVPGTNGLIGATGPQGVAGPAGPVGPTGAKGPQGVPGTNGLNGATGPQGPAGPIGPAGPQGLVGPQGIPGTNLVTTLIYAYATGKQTVAVNGQLMFAYYGANTGGSSWSSTGSTFNIPSTGVYEVDFSVNGAQSNPNFVLNLADATHSLVQPISGANLGYFQFNATGSKSTTTLSGHVVVNCFAGDVISLNNAGSASFSYGNGLPTNAPTATLSILRVR
jgi:hypothetical protein